MGSSGITCPCMSSSAMVKINHHIIKYMSTVSPPLNSGLMVSFVRLQLDATGTQNLVETIWPRSHPCL